MTKQNELPSIYAWFVIVALVAGFAFMTINLFSRVIPVSSFFSPQPQYPTAEYASHILNATCRMPQNFHSYCCDFGTGYEERIDYNPTSQTFVKYTYTGGIAWNPCVG